jgi:hypothetical protein
VISDGGFSFLLCQWCSRCNLILLRGLAGAIKRKSTYTRILFSPVLFDESGEKLVEKGSFGKKIAFCSPGCCRPEPADGSE